MICKSDSVWSIPDKGHNSHSETGFSASKIDSQPDTSPIQRQIHCYANLVERSSEIIETGLCQCLARDSVNSASQRVTMRPLTAYLSLLLTILLCPCGECDPERVSPELHVSLTPDGGVVGSYETSQNGRRIRAFYAIPYAEPPLGKLRFANPIPIRQWTGRRILPTVEQQGCIQRQFHGSQIHIPLREDCLYLNVFTPVVSPTVAS